MGDPYQDHPFTFFESKRIYFYNQDVNSILVMDIKLIKPKEVANILMCSERTLEAWRREEKGPCYYKIEGKILYNLEDILSFIESSRVSAQ